MNVHFLFWMNDVPIEIREMSIDRERGCRGSQDGHMENSCLCVEMNARPCVASKMNIRRKDKDRSYSVADASEERTIRLRKITLEQVFERERERVSFIRSFDAAHVSTYPLTEEGFPARKSNDRPFGLFLGQR